MKFFLSIFFTILAFQLFSQTEQEKEIVDGKAFWIHIVEGGNTLYGLHRSYEVPIEEILKHNPSAADGIQIGQRLLIPVPEEEAEKPTVEADSTSRNLFHEVEEKETLFGIARHYGTTVDRLIELNPNADKGIKIGQQLKLPMEVVKDVKMSDEIESKLETEDTSLVEEKITNYKVTFEDSTVRYTVQKGETLYSIAKRFMVKPEKLSELNNIKRNKIKPGDVLIIPLKKEVVEVIKDKQVVKDSIYQDSLLTPVMPQKEKYEIAVFLPLRLSSNKSIVSGLYDEKTRLDPITEISLDFLLGMEMAIDSIEKMGLNATISFYDTEGRLDVLKQHLPKEEVLAADLLIGPFYSENIRFLAEWAKEKEKMMMVPVAVPTQVLKNNPYVSSLIPSDLTLIGGIAEYLAKHHAHHNVLLVNNSSVKDQEHIDYFKTVYERHLPDSCTYRAHLKSINLGSTSGRDIAREFDLDTHNVFVNLSTDAQSIMAFINTLNAAKNETTAHGKSKVTAFGLREWQKLDALSSYYKNRFELHVPLPVYLNYSSTPVNNLTKKIRSEYSFDASRYTFQGYDVIMHATKSLMLNQDNDSIMGLINKINLISVGEGHGKENGSVFIVKQSDYELHLAGLERHGLFSTSEVEDQDLENGDTEEEEDGGIEKEIERKTEDEGSDQ